MELLPPQPIPVHTNKMHIRPFRATDISFITDIHVFCNHTDAFSRFYQPGMDDYPVSHRLAYYRGLRRAVWKPGVQTFVAETDDSDYSDATASTSKAPEVVGFIVLGRNGTSATARKWQTTSSRGSASSLRSKLETTLLGLEQQYYTFFSSRLNPSYSTENWNLMLPRLYDFDSVIFAESWGVYLFFVHPNWQRKGIGKKLMQLVIERASEEHLPIRVCGAALGGPAYRAAGFQSLTRIGEQSFYDELEFGGESPQAWVWEPPVREGGGEDGVSEGRWVERAKRKIEEDKKAKEAEAEAEGASAKV